MDELNGMQSLQRQDPFFHLHIPTRTNRRGGRTNDIEGELMYITCGRIKVPRSNRQAFSLSIQHEQTSRLLSYLNHRKWFILATETNRPRNLTFLCTPGTLFPFNRRTLQNAHSWLPPLVDRGNHRRRNPRLLILPRTLSSASLMAFPR
ncbi:uncharacterized protein G2W53_014346 [Senna tora]|uniref:Uncharacterized protein n=1 Tax=Senna tora TaxID=362788 RepID=A0A834WT47_9FABA|nr:uncharacterized protein G2W53_014346 [Senna tora]